MAASKMTTDKDKLRDEVLNSLQSIISSCGGECPVDRLYKDYKDLIGSPVPVKQLNHGTLASLLQSLPTLFHCSNRGGQLFIKLKDDSAGNIAKFARNQKIAKRKIKGRPKPARRPGPSSWIPCHDIRYSRESIDHNWREPFRPLHTMANNSGPRPRHPRTGDRKLYFPPGRQPNKMGVPPRLQAPPRRPENIMVNKPRSPPRNSTKSPPPKSNKSPPPYKSKPPSLIMTQPLIQCPPLIKSPPLMRTPPLINMKPALLPTPRVPKVNPSALYYTDGNFTLPRAIRDNQEKQYAPYFEVPPRFKKLENKSTVKTNKQKLEEEMAKRGHKQELVFRSIPCGKKKTRWVSTVTLLGAPVSCYPEDYAQVQEAEEEAARRALEKLLASEEKTTPLPVTRNLMVSMERVKKICEKEEPGTALWLEHVQNIYKEDYKEVLPDNWALEIDRYNTRNNITHGLVVDKLVKDRWTVMVKEKEAPSIIEQHFSQPEDAVNSSLMYESVRQQCLNNQRNQLYQQQRISEQKVNEHLFQVQEVNEHHYQAQDQDVNLNSIDIIADKLEEAKLDGSEDENVKRLPSLELPSAPYWDIYVTYIEDLSSIHFRLIGDNYSDAYEDMVTEMELHYMEDKNLSPVMQPKIGSIYAASHDESWCRVKVISITGSEARVHFLDHGDQENVNISQLHDLHDRFFELPAQGVCCPLAGLEFGGRDQSSLNLLQNLALGQTLIGQKVVSSDDVVSLILYNTHSEEDVNINEQVSKQMDQNFVEPTLPSVDGVAEVYLIHTTSSGDVYVQVETGTYKVLQNLLEMARSRTEEMLGEDGMIDLTRLYLARFSEDGEWYRAVPRGNVDPDGKALMCRLHKVPPSEGLHWTSRTCERILELIPEDSPLLLKVHACGTNGGPPEVELFKRLQPQNELVSINATLSMDESLFSSDGDSNNNSLRKEVTLSPTRMRNRHGSSTSLTPGSSDMSRRFKQPGSLLPVDIPAIGEFFDVYITYAASPSNFAVQPWKMTTKVTALMEEMQAYYSDEKNITSDTQMKVGGYFAVKHTDGSWYRAYLTMASCGVATGLFVDYGDCFVVNLDCVQPLPPVFHSLPCQAIKAKLSGIVPANMDWSPEDSYRFKELVEYQELVSIITNIEQEKDTEEFVLSLRLVNTSDPNIDVYIDEILVKEKRAIKYNE